ncbi:carboxy terminal-processing peptidase [Phaeocystidibacter luteus]|uniref:Tail-specific protease n=1 Tax=Phaeocystidibacter luteus TaxID=911197 RepID=A0A6N6RJV5_9FLAO|nr:carboxy terminal-processing peptidase [Phaeocystidibacter luteus]KAB2814093.1 tail-specific protease [Phaeocystidibacter luteus]
MNLETMKKGAIRTGITIAGGAVLLTALGFSLLGSGQTKDQLVMQIVNDALVNSHFEPKDIDDNLSEEVFISFLDNVDAGKRFFIEADVESLATHKTELDDQFRAGSSAFFDEAYTLMKKRFAEAEGYYKELLASPFDFTIDETYDTDFEADDWAADESELKDRWRRQLKLRILSRIYTDKLDATEEEPFDFDASETKARERELEVHNEWFNNLNDMQRMEWFGAYLNAFSLQFDPHTEYYPPRQQENFEIQMTGQLEGIGAQLRVRGEYVTVESIVTGSASWRQGDLEEGDKIMRVAQEGEEAIDVVGMSINKVVDMVRGPKGTVVTLTVKKKDGNTMEIAIERDIVELEATFARSVVIGEEEKIGYIRLPKFYVNFYDSENRNCADDVKAEIEKLKAQDVDGIIFDLRNNGGGSLQAAIDIVGLFIDRGPVVQVKNRRDGAQTYSDYNSGSTYDGPLVVMVNEGSASASEIVAAAIQDYGRGVVIGPQSTHGKGTVQNVFELDRVVGSRFADQKPLGAIKVTTQKFYRINGHTTQLQGVEPDVVLPYAYKYIAWGEKEYPTALEVDEIASTRYERVPQYDESVWNTARENSKMRVDTSAKFARIEAYAKWLEDQQDETVFNLNWETYQADEERRDEEAKQWDKLTRVEDSLYIYPLPSHLTMFESDSAKEEEYKRWYRGLSHDLYLREASYVMHDMQ